MKQYKTSAELKALAKEALMGKYGVAVGASALYLLITYLLTEVSFIFMAVPGIIGTVLYYLSVFILTVFTGFFAYGFNLIFLKLSCNVPAKMSDLFKGFSTNTKEIFKAQLFRTIITFVACIPCYIFTEVVSEEQIINYIGLYFMLYGIGLLGQFLVMLYYNQTFFIMLDFPNYDAKKALAFSRKLMKGNKGRFIYLTVSFIPLFLLGMLTCCIGYLWIIPYMQATLAQFYLDIAKNND